MPSLTLRLSVPLAALAVTTALLPGAASAGARPIHGAPAARADDAPVQLTPKGEHEDGSDEQSFDKLRDAYYWSRLLSGDDQLTIEQAAQLRSAAARKSSGIRRAAVSNAAAGTAWAPQGPDPLAQVARTSNTLEAVSGRISALAMRRNGAIILGAAQGGVWTYDPKAKKWTSRTLNTDTQSVGALAIAPSDDNWVYLGSGEGALSGDSYYGDGFYRSSDAGVTWQHVSTLFTGQAVTAIAVDPKRKNHVYAATVRGRGGNHRTSSPTAVPYGVYESFDGGSTWRLDKGTTDEIHGATDLVMDPQNPRLLFASFWGDKIYRSTDGGAHWTSALGNLPAGDFLEGGTRFSLGISHPSAGGAATLYTGFDYFESDGTYHPGAIYKSTDNAAHWTATGTGTGIDSVLGYCGTQCFYDNVVKPDPTNPNTVYVLGSYGYNNSPQSGGVYRSTDGGKTWRNLGYDLHPDFHAFAFQPNKTAHVAIGNDGGVWQSSTGGGRTKAGDPLSAAAWENLNGAVDPVTGALVRSTGLQITQFTSIATVPNLPGQYWGGTQDNGTLRKSTLNGRWFDQASGDGGQVIVDQTTPNTINPTVPAYIFGTYFGISPYRYDPAHANTIFGNEAIDGGIDLTDRAEFYIPWIQNRGNTNQMFLGTYRVYRTNNAEAPTGAEVTWSPISGDLTSGCTGPAPNGARGCFVSALGVADGGAGVYAGTLEGWIQVSPDAVSAAHPSWHRTGVGTLPNRPVNQIAVDRSNWRIAYAAYGGFGAATPGNSGHLFATKDGGAHWTNITANLPDVPVNTVVVNPSNAREIYVGTDVGPFLSTDGGQLWFALGGGMPKVAVWQLDYDATNGVLAAGTHGRGAYTLTDTTPRPALVVAKTDAGTPVGPGSLVNYSITVRNIGNADATKVSITDPLPANTGGVRAYDGGVFTHNMVSWSNKTVPAGGSVTVRFTVRIGTLPAGTTKIVNDGIAVKVAGKLATTGSPHATPIAPKHGVSVSPTTGLEGAKVGQQAKFTETITNDGYLTDSFGVGSAGGSWPSAVFDASCTTALTTTPSVAPGASTKVCVKVTVPAGAADNARNTTTLTVTSKAAASVHASAALTSIAVAKATLLVDGDTNAPVDSAPYYKTALTTNHVAFSYWDLAVNPDIPLSYVTAHKTVIAFTGNSYPDPLGPYEAKLKVFLDGGGRLFLSGQDVLDQAAGLAPFVRDYLHVDWDGSEVQNDKATTKVHAVAGNPVTNGLGNVPLDHSVLNATFEDQVTPIAPARPAFTDDSSADDALTVADGPYRVVFLAFPFEAYGTAAQKATLMQRSLTYLNG